MFDDVIVAKSRYDFIKIDLSAKARQGAKILDDALAAKLAATQFHQS